MSFRQVVVLGLLCVVPAAAVLSFPPCQPADQTQKVGQMCVATSNTDSERSISLNVAVMANSAGTFFVTHSLGEAGTDDKLNFSVSIVNGGTSYTLWSEKGIVFLASMYLEPEDADTATVTMWATPGGAVPFSFIAYRVEDPLRITAPFLAQMAEGDIQPIPFPLVTGANDYETQNFTMQLDFSEVQDKDLSIETTFSPVTFLYAGLEKEPMISHPDGAEWEMASSFMLHDSASFSVRVGGPNDHKVNISHLCEFSEQFSAPGTFTCFNGDVCTAPGCCVEKQGVKLCPIDAPFMCQDTTCFGDFCCSMNCTALGSIPRQCVLRGVVTLDVEEAQGGGSSGLSGGAIFLILLVVALAVYCGGGVLYNYYQGEKQFPNVLPHHRFWVEIPSFIGEGCVYLQAKICCKETSKANEYSQGSFAPAPRTSIGVQQGYGADESTPTV